MDQPAETPRKSPGAPKGNTNALKHGFYSRAFRKAETTDLTDLDPVSLEHEIQLLRVFIRRTAVQSAKTETPAESLVLLSVLSKAALSVGSLIRTQRAAIIVQRQTEIDAIAAHCRAEFARARDLIARLEAAANPVPEPDEDDEYEDDENEDEVDDEVDDEDEEEEEEEEKKEEEKETKAPNAYESRATYSLDADAEYCDIPSDCVPCNNHATCPDCPSELRTLLIKIDRSPNPIIESNCSANSIPRVVPARRAAHRRALMNEFSSPIFVFQNGGGRSF